MIDPPISRRRFLKLLGSACALSGLSAGLGGILSACDHGGLATNTTATIAAGEWTSTTQSTSTTTTVTSGPELGRPLRIGLVSAKTGALAQSGKADDWWSEYALAAMSDGLISGDGKSRQIKLLTEDNRSDAKAAAKAAVKLISEARVDILLCSGSPALVNAAADQAEARGCPCLADFLPWRSFVFDRGGALDKPFKWTYAYASGIEDLSGDFLQMWGQLPTNTSVGLVFADDAYGRQWTDASLGLPALATVAGYKCVLPALYSLPAGDFTPQLTELKKSGCEICCGAMSTGDFLAFWAQAKAREYQPKIVTIADALAFPQALEAVGLAGLGLTTGSLWQPDWPFRDSITGRSSADLAQDYVNKTGDQWTAAIGQYAKFEWAMDVFKRMVNVLDKEDVITRVRTTRLETCAGPIDFTASVGMWDPAGSRHPMENVCKAPVCGVQWVKGSTFPFEPKVTANESDPELPVSGSIEPMGY